MDLVDVTDTDRVLAAATGADLLWLESPTNPLLEIADLPALCRAGQRGRPVVAVDNTFATPLLQQPLSLGADVVVHSATKLIGGHSDLLLGVAVAVTEHSGTSGRRPTSGTSPTPTCTGAGVRRDVSHAGRRQRACVTPPSTTSVEPTT